MSPRKTRKQMDAEIAAAVPLSRWPNRPSDPMAGCNVCGQPAEEFEIFLEYGAGDLPPPEFARLSALVFLGVGHRECYKVLERHPRLYASTRGDPGHFPLLCGPCTNREGLECKHPDLRANGGAGLSVNLSDPLRGAILCGSRGRLRVINHALSCTGQNLASES